MRRKGKVDTNQTAIVEALRKVGASVFITSNIGSGFPDLCVGWKDRNLLLEVKSRKGLLTKDQVLFAARWRGQFCVVRDLVDLAIALDLPEDYFAQWEGTTIVGRIK